VIFVLVLTSGLAGQDEGLPTASDGVCLDEFAKFLVDQQVSESRSVAETEKRIRILTKSADFLWKFEETRAREYFGEAYKVATDRFREKGFERKEYGGGISAQLPDYRFEVIGAIARHDPKWAQKLSDELLKEHEATSKDRSPLDRDREVASLLAIALEHVKLNPALSWY